MFVEGKCFSKEVQLIFSTMGPVVKHVSCCEILLLLVEASWGTTWGSSFIYQSPCCNGFLTDLSGFKKSASQLILDTSFLPVNLPGGGGFFLKVLNSEASADNLPGGFLNASASYAVYVNLLVVFLKVTTSATSEVWVVSSFGSIGFGSISGVCGNCTGLRTSFTAHKAGRAWFSWLRSHLTSRRRFVSER